VFYICYCHRIQESIGGGAKQLLCWFTVVREDFS